MRAENLTVESVVLFFCKGTDCLFVRETLKSEFTAEACGSVAVFPHIAHTVPYAPKVGVAYVVGVYTLAVVCAAG